MKKGLLFGSGFLSGVIVTIIVLVIIGLAGKNNSDPTEIKMFDEPGEVINEKSFEVFQVIADNAALVHVSGDIFGLGTIYLMINNSGRYYYDGETITVPKGKCVRQLGIYKYQTKSEDYKTVPIIGIGDK